MKTLYKIIFLSLAVFSFTGCMAGRQVATNDIHDNGPNVNIDLFYQSLSPYGRWINYGGYGNVWIPRVPRNFQPYATNGHWVYSNYGWTWVSNYRWGWAPFHYGRWTFDDYYGWIWIPGNVWAPAWVAWRHSPSYYGWAPLGPGMNINVHLNIPARRWVFVPSRYITYRNVHRYYLPWRQNYTVINNTTIINNIYEQNNHDYFSGPTRRAVQQQTRQNIRPVRVFNSSGPSESRLSRNSLRIYRPTISRSGQETTRHEARPVRVEEPSNARTSPERREARSERTRNTSDRERQDINNRRRTETTRPERRTSPTRQTEQPRSRRTDRNDNRRIQRSENARTRSQRRTRTRTPENTVQRQRPQRSRVQRRETSQRSTPQQRTTDNRSSATRSSRSFDDNATRSNTRPRRRI